jgi:hypothetical protein
MTTTPVLNLTLMAPNMAQKEVVFNEAIVAFDALFRGSVISASLTADPASPALGDCYVIAHPATGLWSGNDYAIAFYYNGWQFITPPLQIQLYDVATSEFIRYEGSSLHWVSIPATTVAVLADLTDVTGTGSATNGQVLTWNSGASKWEPATATFTASLASLTDVNVTEGSGINGYYLTWNNSTSKWVATALPSIPTLAMSFSDIHSSGATTGEVAVFDSTIPGIKFVAQSSLSVPTTIPSLSDAGDVSYAGLTTGNSLIWNGAAWAPSSVTATYSFAAMTDGPGSFTGHANEFLVVNSIETALAYVSLSTLLASVDIKLQSLDDVPGSIGSPGQVLAVNTGASGFVYITPSTGVVTLAALNDVTVSEGSGIDGYVFYWNNSASKWEAENPVLLSVAHNYLGINTQTADYTLVLADASKLVAMNLSSANTATVPLNSAVAFPIDTVIDVVQSGTGVTTLVATSGVTLNAPGGTLALSGRYAKASLVKVATDTWDVVISGVGGGVPLAVLNGGTSVETNAVSLNFVNATSITTSAGAVTITLPTGGGGGGGSGTLAGDSDVAIASPATGQALIYNGTDWTNASLSAVTAGFTDLTFGSSSSVFGSTFYASTQTFTVGAKERLEIRAYIARTGADDVNLIISTDGVTGYGMRSQGSDGNQIFYEQHSGGSSAITTSGATTIYEGFVKLELTANVTAASNAVLTGQIEAFVLQPTQETAHDLTAGPITIYIASDDVAACVVQARIVTAANAFPVTIDNSGTAAGWTELTFTGSSGTYLGNTTSYASDQGFTISAGDTFEIEVWQHQLTGTDVYAGISADGGTTGYEWGTNSSGVSLIAHVGVSSIWTQGSTSFSGWHYSKVTIDVVATNNVTLRANIDEAVSEARNDTGVDLIGLCNIYAKTDDPTKLIARVRRVTVSNAFAGGGGGGSALTIKDNGTSIETATTSINFVNATSITDTSGAVTVTLPTGGGSALAISNNGTSVDTAAATLNFVGAASITTSSHDVTVTLPSGGVGGASAIHRYWRMRLVELTAGEAGWGACLIAYKDAAGTVLSTGGTPSSSVADSGGWSMAEGFDGGSSSGHGWYSGTSVGMGSYLAYEFVAPVAVSTVEFAPLTTYDWSMPPQFAVDYSDDGERWHEATVFTTAAGADNVVQTFTVEFVGGGALLVAPYYEMGPFAPPDPAWFTSAPGDGAVTIAMNDLPNQGMQITQNGASGNSVAGAFKAVPSGSSWAVTARIVMTELLGNYPSYGLMIMDTAGKAETFVVQSVTGQIHYGHARWNSNTSFNSNELDFSATADRCPPWVRIRYDGTNFYLGLSADGVGWMERTVSATAFLGTLAYVGIISTGYSNDSTFTSTPQSSVLCTYYDDPDHPAVNQLKTTALALEGLGNTTSGIPNDGDTMVYHASTGKWARKPTDGWKKLTFSGSSATLFSTPDVFTSDQTFALSAGDHIEIEFYVHKTSSQNGVVFLSADGTTGYVWGNLSSGSNILSGIGQSSPASQGNQSYTGTHHYTVEIEVLSTSAFESLVFLDGWASGTYGFTSIDLVGSTVALYVATDDITKTSGRYRIVNAATIFG